ATFTIDMSSTTMNWPRHTSASTTHDGDDVAVRRPAILSVPIIEPLLESSCRGRGRVIWVATRHRPRPFRIPGKCVEHHNLVPGARRSWYRHHLAPGPERGAYWVHGDRRTGPGDPRGGRSEPPREGGRTPARAGIVPSNQEGTPHPGR